MDELDRQLFADLYRFECMKTSALMPYSPEKVSEHLETLGKRYRSEIIPWVLDNKKGSSSSAGRKQEKKERKKVDLKDAKSVEGYYYAVIQQVREREAKMKQDREIEDNVF